MKSWKADIASPREGMTIGITRFADSQIQNLCKHPKVNNRQLFFIEPSGEERKKQQALMNMLDKANDKYGHRILTLASSGVGRKPWHMRQERKSPRYTTCWAELPLVK